MLNVHWGRTSTGWRPQQDELKTVSILLSVTLVMWVTCKIWTFVMELTTHTWPRRQRSLGSLMGGGIVSASGAGPTIPHISEVHGKINGCRLQRCSFACASACCTSISCGLPKPETNGKENSAVQPRQVKTLQREILSSGF